MGCSVRTMGYVGAPHISAMDRAVISNMSVQMVTDGVPAFLRVDSVVHTARAAGTSTADSDDDVVAILRHFT